MSQCPSRASIERSAEGLSVMECLRAHHEPASSSALHARYFVSQAPFRLVLAQSLSRIKLSPWLVVRSYCNRCCRVPWAVSPSSYSMLLWSLGKARVLNRCCSADGIPRRSVSVPDPSLQNRALHARYVMSHMHRSASRWPHPARACQPSPTPLGAGKEPT